MERDGAWSYGPPLSRACWTPSQVAEGRHVAVWDPGPSAQALARPSLRYNSNGRKRSHCAIDTRHACDRLATMAGAMDAKLLCSISMACKLFAGDTVGDTIRLQGRS